MRKIIFFLSILFCINCFGQTDTSKWLRAFPITAYIVDMNDTTKLVQLQMPDGLSLNDKQPGVVWGMYDGSKEAAVEKGYGRCNLIKGDYYYFTISNNKSGVPLKEGDLLYTMMDKTAIFYGQGPKLASHFIRLQNVYEEPLFDRYNIFNYWTEQEEQNLIDSMVSDIQFTGKYFIENNPSMDKPIISGDYKGQKTLYVMAECQPGDVKKFLDYVIARPRLYAGRDWKISEIFATWLSEGAPTIIR
ncbi:MAG: hypothetical protein KA330_03230 [Chitinophagaceae bacterium]|nr:hypothetical protein [Chitinophagaceae bacterium]